MSIGKNIETIKAGLPEGIKLIAVSKTQSIEVTHQAYQSGHRIFGENKAQEAATKASALPADIEWHFIGHLQTNKVKLIAPFVNTIHSVDSIKLLYEIDKEAKKNNRIIKCLLQFHIASEETKFGLDMQEAITFIESPEIKTFHNISITGVMGMATFSSDQNLVRREFKNLKEIFSWIKETYY
ncbi:MAG: YggS family pyridoxal phosphate-dependent enzyme, partial [Bacteroidetes bacterium HGW-Bacteroidetes-22]